MDTAPGAWSAGRGRRRRRWLLVATGLVGAVAAGLAWWWTGGPAALVTTAAPEAPEVVGEPEPATPVEGEVPDTDTDGGVDASADPPRETPVASDEPADDEDRRADADGDDGGDDPDEDDEDVAADGRDDQDRDGEDTEPAGPTTGEVQGRLAELGYLVGPADGEDGPQTRAAVMALQRVNGLQVDGIVGPRTTAALADPAEPQLRGGPATRIEVDLTRQLLHLVEDGRRVATLHASSGSGQPYTTSSGGTAYGNTPVGEFVIERRIRGERRADLGVLYDPLYFYRGWAIHGSGSVPATPASHGCVRITRADARWLFERVPDGTPVHLYGGQHVFVPSR